MSKSNNPKIQQLMDEVANLGADESLEEKLNEIARKVAEEQKKMKAILSGHSTPAVELAGDPADEFACEGCQ